MTVAIKEIDQIATVPVIHAALQYFTNGIHRCLGLTIVSNGTQFSMGLHPWLSAKDDLALKLLEFLLSSLLRAIDVVPFQIGPVILVKLQIVSIILVEICGKVSGHAAYEFLLLCFILVFGVQSHRQHLEPELVERIHKCTDHLYLFQMRRVKQTLIDIAVKIVVIVLASCTDS